MFRNRRFALGFGLIASCMSMLVLAHSDDPKERDTEPPYPGTGWTRDGGWADGSEGSIAGTFPAVGVELLAWLTPNQFPGGHTYAADCWGYTSPSGRRYAIIGLTSGNGFVEITNPGSPVIIGVIPGPESTWHDVEIYQHYAYAVSEHGEGIQVIDLNNIDAATNRIQLVNTVLTGGTTATHTVFINTQSGYLYRAGGGSNGLRIYSLADPANPTYVASWSDRYCHEVNVITYNSGPYAGREIAFCCGGFNGGWTQTGLDILDVTDKQNIINLYPQRVTWPQPGYSHQVWLSPDRRYAYLNDELDEQDFDVPTRTIVIDVSNLTAPVLMPPYTNGNTAVGHNLYVKGRYIYESNYRSGLRVFDARNPLAPVEFAYFDTYPNNDNASFNGLWGNYPFFPGGIIIGSDRERGLFIWRLEPRKGDANCDGSMNLFDIDPFVMALSNPQAYSSQFPDCDIMTADMNTDGSVNLFDIQQFVTAIGG